MNKSELSVFIVDDDYFFLHLLSAELSKSYEVKITSFNKAESSIMHLDKNPDIVFLDFRLDSENPNNINGLVALKKIKEANEKVHVIMMSSAENIEDLKNCVANGATDYIIKGDFTSKLIGDIINKVKRSNA